MNAIPLMTAPIPAPMAAPMAVRSGPRLRTTQAHDPDEHARHLTAWQQRYDQLGCGAYTGGLTELRLPRVQVFRESTRCALRQTCRVWPDALWLGLPDPHLAPGRAPLRLNGQPDTSAVGRRAVLVSPGGQDFELVTPDHHSLFGLVVPLGLLHDAAARQGVDLPRDALHRAALLQVGAAPLRACLNLLEALLPRTLDQTGPDSASGSGAGDPVDEREFDPDAGLLPAARLEALLVGAVLDLLDSGAVDAGSRLCLARRQKVVAQAHGRVLAQPEQPPTIAELCDHLHVSRRTLQYCFETVMGHSPIHSLRALRLNAVRRLLRAGSPHSLAVQDVAAQWGFGHLSQFSSDYRRLFGEAPSQTLKAH